MAEVKRLARPERIRFSLADDATGATPLQLPEKRTWSIALFIGVMFAIFAGIEWKVIAEISDHDVRNVFDLMFVLFQGFWALGWAVAVAILGGLTVLFCLYSESTRLQGGRLVNVPRLGPLKIILEYDLARVRNIRLESAGSRNVVRIKFDYGQGSRGLGNTMPRSEAERLADIVTRAAAAAGATETLPPAPVPETPRPKRAPSTSSEPLPPLSIRSPSGLALIAANLVPLAGVLFFGWDLASLMVLFWAESAVIGFYTALKMAVVGKLAALFAVPFFIGHFGGFMAVHFLLIYSFFVRGLSPAGAEPGVREALLGVFIPVWQPLAGLFISHGVSFYWNFIGRREYVGATTNGLMTAPYNRIIMMQLTLIFGGWIILALKTPVAGLATLVLLKTAVDFSAHSREHAAGTH